MRHVFSIMLGLLLMANPSISMALEAAAARHLLSRSGFDPTIKEIGKLHARTHAEAVAEIIATLQFEAVLAAPSWTSEAPLSLRSLRNKSRELRRKVRKKARQQGLELKSWWLREMVLTPSPLTERMTLFWHNHFTSSLRKVKRPHLLYRQNQKFRRLGTRNVADLFRAMINDPAVLFYLDNHRNNKRAPNENFARELLELFALGEDHYVERDIKEVARAMSGYGLDPVDGSFRFRHKQHDRKAKTVLGQTGNFDGDAIIELLLRQPRTAEFLSQKIWLEFVGQPASNAQSTHLANVLRGSNYAVKPWLSALFNSAPFKSTSAHGTRIKSPAEFVVGLVRVLDLRLPRKPILARAMKRLGQDLFDPPNARGWRGGRNWISADTLLMRQQMIGRFTRGDEMLASMDAMSMRPVSAGARQTESMRQAKLKQRRSARDRGNARTVLQRWLNDVPQHLRNGQSLVAMLLPLAPVDMGWQHRPVDAKLVESLLLDPVYQLN